MALPQYPPAGPFPPVQDFYTLNDLSVDELRNVIYDQAAFRFPEVQRMHIGLVVREGGLVTYLRGDGRTLHHVPHPTATVKSAYQLLLEWLMLRG